MNGRHGIADCNQPVKDCGMSKGSHWAINKPKKNCQKVRRQLKANRKAQKKARGYRPAVDEGSCGTNKKKQKQLKRRARGLVRSAAASAAAAGKTPTLVMAEASKSS